MLTDILSGELTLARALQLLALPRILGVDPRDGVEVTATFGRYGCFVRKGAQGAPLPDLESVCSITLEEALALLRATEV